MAEACLLQLTCADKTEAKTISERLLAKKLIACAKIVPVESAAWWNGNIEAKSEILLLMESSERHFETIESEITKLHSYDTFVLTATPITRISQKARHWLNENII